MESLKLNLDTEINGQTRTFVVEVPYQDGIVATSEFCPAQLLSDTVELMEKIFGALPVSPTSDIQQKTPYLKAWRITAGK